MNEKLAADTTMGAVTLFVADLDVMIRFYRDGVALDLIAQEGDTAYLGRGAKTLVILKHSPELKHAAPHEAGLFHTAILFDSEAALAASVYSTAQRYPGQFTGSADHLVSRAFYFNDPEGNGVELYWDRDRTEWSWVHGQVEMDSLFLDPNAYLREHLTEATVAAPNVGDATVGHVHLSVGDIDSAREFYVNQLGFDTTNDFRGSALFVSAGGYHHHMAMNIWNSRGAGRRQPTLGLGEVDLVVPTFDEIGTLTERMRHYGVDARDDGRSVTFDDPWANQVRVTVAA
ncbi:VOC family protein [Gulosibacter sp. ACHW.36C]|uniref:VOC family protein n=1 Tax=Gulosibacter sediminis TaxID=1729695 RepID=A0ABY4N168_9MICO|nr:VOC family protein [Gulosibacter sediminis]UQN15700.1 VOC family protein [Gulosibacter sediminis]